LLTSCSVSSYDRRLCAAPYDDLTLLFLRHPQNLSNLTNDRFRKNEKLVTLDAACESGIRRSIENDFFLAPPRFEVDAQPVRGEPIRFNLCKTQGSGFLDHGRKGRPQFSEPPEC
jgi:hypothetical protein